MRVAMDEQIFALQPYGGISRLFASLAREFYRDPDLDVELLPLAAPIINRYVLDDDLVRTRMAVWDAGHEYRSLGRYFMKFHPRRGLDLVHNTFYLPHGLARYPKAKRVVTVYDMIPELMPQTRRRLDFLTLKKRYVESADHVICISEATRADLLRTYRHVKAPTSVVHLGVDEAFRPDAPPHPALPPHYVLFVGHRGQYKDATVLMRAFGAIADRHDDLALVFVGGGDLREDEKSLLSSLNVLDRTVHLSLTDDAMPSAYAHAQMTVFPSRFEGFGLPALESMASGTPTILARATSLPEVGGDAALYFTPGDASELANLMDAVLTDATLASSLSAAGLSRSAEFTWQRTARETAQAYRSTLG